MTHRLASCSCAQLKLTVSEEPVRVSVCHCLNCQRRSGSVFAAQARFRRSAVQITGASSTHVIVGDEGGKATFHFCPKCGATVYFEPQAMPEYVVVPIGAFADPGFPAPSVSVYESRMHGWVQMPVDMDHM